MSETHLEVLSTDADEAVLQLEAALRELKEFGALTRAARETGEATLPEMAQSLKYALSRIGMAAPRLLALQAGLGNIALEAQAEARGQVDDDASTAS